MALTTIPAGSFHSTYFNCCIINATMVDHMSLKPCNSTQQFHARERIAHCRSSASAQPNVLPVAAAVALAADAAACRGAAGRSGCLATAGTAGTAAAAASIVAAAA